MTIAVAKTVAARFETLGWNYSLQSRAGVGEVMLEINQPDATWLQQLAQALAPGGTPLPVTLTFTPTSICLT